MFIALILACRGAVHFSKVEIITSGLRENDISVFLNGFQLLIEIIESIFADFVLVSINTLSNFSIKGIKFSLNQL
ncbi:hypothetical protein IKN40_01210 [bacterium]|nr:hypothetical protein [bacterium]